MDIGEHVISHFALLVSEAQIPGNIMAKVMKELVQWVFSKLKQKVEINITNEQLVGNHRRN